MKTLVPKYLFLAARFTSCFSISACENDIKKIDDLMKKKTAVEEGTGVTAYLSQQGIMKAKLTAPYMSATRPIRPILISEDRSC